MWTELSIMGKLPFQKYLGRETPIF